MLAARELGIGLIGHQFMGRAHSQAWLDVAAFFPKLGAKPVMRMLCGIGDDVADVAEQWGWQSHTQDYRELLARDDIDVVDICTPNRLHAQMAVDAAKAGKHILCEKPLAMDAAECLRMLRAVRKAGVKHQVSFCYRRCPAVMLARELVRKGKVGRVFHVRASYLQGWLCDPRAPMRWRLRKEVTGSGAHGDLNAHLVDLARHVTGDEIAEVCAVAETFTKRRPVAPGSRRKDAVTVDDALAFMARFASGAVGTFEASRCAQGHRNDCRIEIDGERGSAAFAFERMNELEVFDTTRPKAVQGWTTVSATRGDSHAYAGHYWPPGHVIGYEHQFISQAADLVEAIVSDKPAWPDFADGLRCQEVLDAALASAESRGWVTVTHHR